MNIRNTILYLSSIVLLLVFAKCKHNTLTCSSTIEKVNALISEDRQQSLLKLDSAIHTNTYHNNFYLGLLYLEKAHICELNLDNKKALVCFEKAEDLLHKSNEENIEEYLSRIYLGIGSNNSVQGKRALATEYVLKSLALSKALLNVKREGQCYAVLAHSYYQYKDYKKAIDYTKKAIDLYIQEKDTVGLSETYNNLAVIYKNQKNYYNAFAYNYKSLEINKLIGDNDAIARSYNNIGQVYNLIDNSSKAVEYYKKAAKVNQENGIYNTSPLMNLGEYYLNKGKVKVADYYYSKALGISLKAENIYKQKKIANKLLQIALENKKFDNAIKYQKKRDSLQLLQTQLENKEKLRLTESQHKLASNKVELQQVKAINTKNRIIFISVLISFIILGLLFWQRLKHNQLKLQQEKIHLEQAVLRSQMNPHFIFNALSAIQNSLFDNDPIKSASYLSRFAKLIRQNFDFIAEKEIPLSDEIDALKNYMDTQKIRFIDKFEYKILVSEEVDADTIKIPPLLLQPLVENAIEHGFKGKRDKGIIHIKVSEENNKICYEITDNGKGFSVNTRSNKLHALDILKKRISLLNIKDRNSIVIVSNEQGTSIKFNLSI